MNLSGTGRRMARRCLGVSVAVLICSGCGGGQEVVALPSLTNSVAPLPSLSAVEEDAVASAYTKFVAMLDRADSLPAESRKAQLATVMVDPQLSRVLRRIDEMKRQNIATYGHVIVHVKSVQLTESGATVIDCQDSRGAGTMNSVTGKKINRGVQQGSTKALLVKGSDGQWRVSKSITVGEGC
ncbi:hypothetical protein E1200_07105 [Actinomadura sp. GC306]|uniref:hypothetical protein n=1 Tax=Actinomadura sp. GC306 TaxID=2530367 RepID=UPI0010534F88|nr:hypothetical protein [Actinomadura sp. GC306]TDC69850.1 hypothetical protein E1200_07105 [Actinomadura sp. GC306]